MARTITTADERPIFIRSGGDDLFGVLTRPGASNGVGVVLLLGGIYSLSITRNRFSVLLARHFASLGYHVLRLDVHGTGESAGRVEEYELEKPFDADLEAAARWLQAQGIVHLVFVGSCFGARTCLAASEAIEGVRGVALLSMPVLERDKIGPMAALQHSQKGWRHVVRRALRPEVVRRLLNPQARRHYTRIARSKLGASRGENVSSRTSGSVLRQLEKLASNRVPTLMAYGTEDLWDELEMAREGRLGALLSAPTSSIEILHFDDLGLHGFSSLEAQHRSAELLEAWLTRVASPQREPAAPIALER
jgi:pimeloyl-ACP methyl ester carboxylesterase